MAGILLTAGSGASAWAADDFAGTWLDNIVGEMSIGAMTVKPGTIEFKRAAHYAVTAAGSFGTGDLFKVTGVNKPRDPMGCGPDHRVSYIAITPLLPVAGATPQSVKVLFFAGDAAPDPSTYKNGPFLCNTHPFDRAGSD